MMPTRSAREHAGRSPAVRRGSVRVVNILVRGATVLVLAIWGCGQSRLDEILASARSGDVDQQRQALRDLADLGAEAAPAIPDLIELAGHSHADVRRLAGLALGNIASAIPPDELESQRPHVIAVLTEQLDDDEAAVRNTAAFGLLGIDPGHAAARERLLAAMREGDGGIIDRLSRSRPPPTWAAPTLIDILTRDERPGLRRLAAVALGEIDPDAGETRAALRQATQDSDDRVRSAAEVALRQ